MHVNKDILSWLTKCPPGDNNFKVNLQKADVATLEAALRELPAEKTKTARRLIEARLKRNRKLNKKYLGRGSI